MQRIEDTLPRTGTVFVNRVNGKSGPRPYKTSNTAVQPVRRRLLFYFLPWKQKPIEEPKRANFFFYAHFKMAAPFIFCIFLSHDFMIRS